LIHTYALTLLRNGECHTFPELLSRIITDIKLDTDDSISLPPTNGVNGTGKNGVNGKKKGTGRGEDGQSLALPKNVVDEGVRVTRECLESVCEFQP